MNNNIEQAGGAGGNSGSGSPADPARPSVDPTDLPGGADAPGREGEIPLNPEHELPLPDDDPLAPEDPPSAAI
ncbi:hypothetical protein [Pseudomonas sp. KNUC1026]|uniref:hypothetical protein n=1 Tax=Pseudomonas sp. KNUC1026 TaxID=2893890 RepID=UPI001F1755FA|nr:hypothetical protein [Pseudomonas sp. KNUC1026]UFH50793.1 hypothetical protein LN139_06620 [Pseudomonas sp. KNUC1026]